LLKPESASPSSSAQKASLQSHLYPSPVSLSLQALFPTMSVAHTTAVSVLLGLAQVRSVQTALLPLVSFQYALLQVTTTESEADVK